MLGKIVLHFGHLDEVISFCIWQTILEGHTLHPAVVFLLAHLNQLIVLNPVKFASLSVLHCTPETWFGKILFVESLSFSAPESIFNGLLQVGLVILAKSTLLGGHQVGGWARNCGLLEYPRGKAAGGSIGEKGSGYLTSR